MFAMHARKLCETAVATASCFSPIAAAPCARDLYLVAAVPECAIFKMEQQLYGWLSQCRDGAKQAAVSARKPRACHASHWSQASSRQSSKLCIAMVEATFRFMQAAAKTAPRRVLGISSNLSSRERRARTKNMRRTGRQGDTTDGGGKGGSVAGRPLPAGSVADRGSGGDDGFDYFSLRPRVIQTGVAPITDMLSDSSTQ